VEPEPKTAEFPVSCAQPREKGFPGNQRYRWKAYAPKVCLLGVTTYQMSTTPNAEPTNNFGFRKFL